MSHAPKYPITTQDLPEIKATKQWIDEVIVGLNFCPFAKKEFTNNTIFYLNTTTEQLKSALKILLEHCVYLDKNPDVETSLIIFSEGFRCFKRYLDLVDAANVLLIDSGFEGVFQLATMHPEYCFADECFDSASNFTNRSPYPMLHIIREASMERVLSVYKQPENIPINNIALTKQYGYQYFADILAHIHQKHPQR
jgi:hypothetical protein